MIAIMIMLFSLPVNAQGTVGYARWDESHKTLTFYGGESVPEGAFKLNTGEEPPQWSGILNCTTVVFHESFKDVRPNSCCRWFGGFEKLTTIQGIENLNTEEVTNMSSMFENCPGLTSLDVSKFNTAKVTNMSCMFNYCLGLTSLDLSSFNTAKVTDMSGMFSICKSLSSLDLSSFNTAKVENMSEMFNTCESLSSLDLSSFNTAEVTNMSEMFNDCSALTTIYVSDDFSPDTGTNGSDMFWGCLKLKGATSYDSGKTGIDMANCETGYFTKSNLTPYVKWNADTKVLTFKVANYIEGTNGEYKLNDGASAPGWSIDEVKNNCTNVVFTPSFNHARPTSCCSWFSGFSNLTTIEGIKNLNTEDVPNMSHMFQKCSSLTSLGVSKFNTAKVTNMSDMFNGCSGLTSLDLSSFNTAKVTNMSGMFYGCGGLTSLDLTSFNTAEVEYMDYMFGGCENISSLDLSSFNTAKVTNMSGMFDNCSDLTTIYVSDNFNIDKVTFDSYMFLSCSNLVGAASYNPEKTDHTMANYRSGYFKTYFTLGENKVELCGNPLTTNSLNLTGDYDFTPKYEFKANEATYSRDLSSSGSTWFSLCLPFAYTPNNFNFTAYKLNGATANAVEIEEITGEIAAGTPVLFKFNGEDKKIDINITATDDDKIQIVKAPVVDGSTAVNGPNGSSLQLCGTYQTKTFSSEDGNAFILLNDKLMNPAKMLDTGVTKVGVKPFRAYMTLTASAPAQLASARAFSIGRGGEGNEGTTAIDLLNSVATDDAEYYDINGRRIDAPVKGVNIVRRGNKTIKLIIK